MFFDKVPKAPPDPIFGLLEAYSEDGRPEKVNLMVGIYKNDKLEAGMFPSVIKAMGKVQTTMADYLPIDGLHELVERLGFVIFGKLWDAERMYGAHTAGGTAALRVGVEFLAQEVGKTVYVPNHTWPTHRLVLERVGCSVESYPYYSEERKGFDLDAMVNFLSSLKPKSIVLLHACCHNPTGCDPTVEEWKVISRVMKERRLFPFFDFAYQGFGSGVEEDAAGVRAFVQDGHEMMVAYSCSKNFSMYCHRVGMLFTIGGGKKEIGSQIKRMIRGLYSNPPAFGAWVVMEALKDLGSWQRDLEKARHRLNGARNKLIAELEKSGRDFGYLKKHRGMFSFMGLNKRQSERMIEEFAIYMTDNGRISVAGLSDKNIAYVAKGLLTCAGR